MSFLSSLAFARHRIHFNLNSSRVMNLRINLHLKMLDDREQDEQQKMISLHEVSHYQLEQLMNHDDVVIYLFFPHLHDSQRSKNSISYLKDHQLKQ